MTTLPGRLRLALAVAGIVVATATSVAVQSPPRPMPPPPVDREAVGRWTCRGEVPPDHVARADRQPAGSGEPLSVAQDPPVLFANHEGPVRLREVLVAGDMPAVRFWRYNPTGDDVPETWARTGTKLVGTRTASVFSPEWSEEVFRTVLGSSATGVDYPVLYWGAIEVPGDPARWRAVYLRLASGGLPVSRVTRINERVQFASHVVNLVVPQFWSSRAEGGLDEVDLPVPARVFYEHFADVYDLLAFVGEPSIFLDDGYGAWHRNVRNEVLGINAAVMDNSRLYGSDRVLQGVEVYRDALATTFRLANHEISHQWGHYFDWNYFAARLEDPNGTGPASYEGHVAFDRAARRAVDLQTRILPRSLPAIDQPLDVDYPPFFVGDCPAVQFAQPVATYLRAGDRITISGTVVARDRSDFHEIGIRFWPYGGDPAKRVLGYGDLGASGKFSMQFEFRDAQVGRYCMEVFLFWPDAPAQYARCTLTPVTVVPAR